MAATEVVFSQVLQAGVFTSYIYQYSPAATGMNINLWYIKLLFFMDSILNIIYFKNLQDDILQLLCILKYDTIL